MRLHIGLCRHCWLNDYCEHRDEIKAGIGKSPLKTTVIYRCKKYAEVLPRGLRVFVWLSDIRTWETGGSYEPPEPNAEWQHIGIAEGTVLQSTKGGRFVVALDAPVTLNLPQNKSWYDAKEVEVTHVTRRMDQIMITGWEVVAATHQNG